MDFVRVLRRPGPRYGEPIIRGPEGPDAAGDDLWWRGTESTAVLRTPLRPFLSRLYGGERSSGHQGSSHPYSTGRHLGQARMCSCFLVGRPGIEPGVREPSAVLQTAATPCGLRPTRKHKILCPISRMNGNPSSVWRSRGGLEPPSIAAIPCPPCPSCEAITARACGPVSSVGEGGIRTRGPREEPLLSKAGRVKPLRHPSKVSCLQIWRRERDSNPRTALAASRFQGGRV